MTDVEPPGRDLAPEPVGRVLSNRLIVICAGVLTVLAAGLVWLLLARFGDGTDASKTRLDAIRTVGTIVLGAGGAVALLLAARRQQTAERDLVEKRRDLTLKERAQAHAEQVQRHAENVAAETQAHQLRVAEATEADAAARRITELFDTAVGKLGSDKAAVRFGGLYALERLAGHAPDQQRAIAHVLCAYLRMPYFSPGPNPDSDLNVENPARTRYQHLCEEREVRVAVQRVLADHLRSDRAANYWADIVLDLTGATLIDSNWTDCKIPDHARFYQVTFLGGASFRAATFIGSVGFNRATLDGLVSFCGSSFAGNAHFGGCTFIGEAWFGRATLAGGADFDGASFIDKAMFGESSFGLWHEALNLGGVGGATFGGITRFDNATFSSDARFGKATFADAATFDKTTFAGDTWFDTTANVDLSDAIGRLRGRGADTKDTQWPQGWSVCTPVATPSTRQDEAFGELVKEPQPRLPVPPPPPPPPRPPRPPVSGT
jgi:uncharacterized protein YjbI with pentapeptide repeats